MGLAGKGGVALIEKLFFLVFLTIGIFKYTFFLCFFQKHKSISSCVYFDQENVFNIEFFFMLSNF